jgi:hypothetical protein
MHDIPPKLCVSPLDRKRKVCEDKDKVCKDKGEQSSSVFHSQWLLRRGPAFGTPLFQLSRITNVMWAVATVRVVRLVCGMKSDLLPYSSDFNCRAFNVFFLSSLLLTLLSLRHHLRELPSVSYHHSFFFKTRNGYQKHIPMDAQKNKIGVSSHFWFFPRNYLLFSPCLPSFLLRSSYSYFYAVPSSSLSSKFFFVRFHLHFVELVFLSTRFLKSPL